MPTQTTDELRVFHQFLSEKLGAGRDESSPEEVIDEWRVLHPDSESSAADAIAIQEAICDMANGDCGMPIEDFDREFRMKYNLPGKP